jgi:capsular polysaccharide biosynthesis protein
MPRPPTPWVLQRLQRDNHGMTLHDLIVAVRTSVAAAVVVALVAGAATYVLVGRQTPVYEAQATLLTSTLDATQRDFGTTLVTAPALAVTTYRGVITSRPVVEEALRSLTETVPTAVETRELQGALSVRAEDAGISAFLRIAVRHVDPGLAQALANAVAEAAVRWDAARATQTLESITVSLTTQIDSLDLELARADPAEVPGLERARADLAVQLSAARALRSAAVGRITLFEAALVPDGPVAPRPLRSAVLAAAMAAFVTFGLLLLRWSAARPEPGGAGPDDRRFTVEP